MKLALSEEQELLRSSVARFLDDEATPARVRAAEPLGFDAALWAGLVELGVPAMRAPESAGGMSLFDAALVAEEAGRHVAPVPLVEVMVAAGLLARLGDAGRPWFDRVQTGQSIVVMAFRPVPDGEQVVPGGAVADAVIARDGDRVVLVERAAAHVSAANLGRSAIDRIDLRQGDRHVLAEGVHATALFLAAVEEWKLLTAAAQTGLSRRALEMASVYAGERHQFGRPIGSFQGVAHPLADAVSELDGARLLVWRAIWAIATARDDAGASISMAFWWASQASRNALLRALRTFGGYGLSVEYDIQLYFRRGKAMALPLGDPHDELVRVGDRLWLDAAADLPEAGEIGIDFGYGDEAEAFRQEVERFFDTEMTPDLRARAHQSTDSYDEGFQRKLAGAGLLYPDWPVEHGGQGRGRYDLSVLGEVYEANGWSRVMTGTTNMGAQMTMRFGSDALKAEALPRFADGSATSCLGFTEPSAGSDMFATRTRATRDGSDWIVNGQKIFTTGAHIADYVFLLTRTDPEATKHRGLTIFLVPMNLPGIEVQPVHTIQDERTNITFYSDVRVPDIYRLGAVDGGLEVMSAAMALEHGGEGYHVSHPALLDAGVAWARGNGAASMADPAVRARLARVAVHVEVADLLCRRAVWASVEGVASRSDGPMSKLFSTDIYVRDAADLLELTAPDSLFEGDDPLGVIEFKHRHALGQTIYGGTSEVHRSLVAEQALGLPKTRA